MGLSQDHLSGPQALDSGPLPREMADFIPDKGPSRLQHPHALGVADGMLILCRHLSRWLSNYPSAGHFLQPGPPESLSSDHSLSSGPFKVSEKFRLPKPPGRKAGKQVHSP